MKVRLKPVVGTKQVNSEHRKMVKSSVILEIRIDVYKVITNFSNGRVICLIYHIVYKGVHDIFKFLKIC